MSTLILDNRRFFIETESLHNTDCLLGSGGHMTLTCIDDNLSLVRHADFMFIHDFVFLFGPNWCYFRGFDVRMEEITGTVFVGDYHIFGFFQVIIEGEWIL